MYHILRDNGVAAVCAPGKGCGCSESVAAYYRQNVELQKVVDNIEKHSKKQ